MSSSKVRYFVFDIESVADGQLVSDIRYPGLAIEPSKAVAKYRAELMEKHESDFIPYTFQIPVSVAIIKVDEHLNLVDLVTLDAPEYRPHIITENFWRGWVGYEQPTLVSFNGRTFDVPVMELAAMRYGISVPAWFNINDRAYDQSRNRYNTRSHLDLQDIVTNFGATRFSGGLNLIARILGKPGKMEVTGDMVQDLYEAGKIQEIDNYCRCDVLDTYFVFLRVNVMTGKITLQREQELVAATRQWLEEQSEEHPIYADYIAGWGDWDNPWLEEERAETRAGS